MADKAIFEIIVTSKGLKITQKEVDELGNSVKRSTKNTRDASKAQDDFNYKLNQGASGVSSAARSFSKLNQTIGSGPNGLVGAYATLAANAFAVSAAFNALRQAAQVEQMMKGLEVQGARTGRSLTGLSKDLQELTNYSISAADAMQATALMSSAGFNSQGIKDLTAVANNAALALGRNVPDALDRISKGVTKLEPELLDELGIMTKLSEAQSMYALKNNKSVASLTSFEKRQAMLNAVVAEGEAKFGGLSDQVSANPYDQLAATFSNLTKDVLGFANAILGPIARIFGANQGMLLGGVLLFVSSIKKQLMPALFEMSKNAQLAKNRHLEEAEAIKVKTAETLKNAKAVRDSAVIAARSKTATIAGAALPKKFRADEIKQGTLSLKELDEELKRLDSSIRARELGLEGRGAAPVSDNKRAQKEAELELIKKERDNLESLIKLETKGETDLIPLREAARKGRLEYIAATKLAAMEGKKASALESAASGDIVKAWEQAKEAALEYSRALAAQGRQNRVKEDGSIADQSILDKLVEKAKGIAGSAGIFAETAAAGFMKFLPYIGIATTALSGAYGVYKNFLQTDAEKARIEALDRLRETLDNTAKSVEELSRINEASIPVGLKAAQTLTIQSNATAQIADSFKQVQEASEKAAKNNETDSFWKALIGTPEDAVSYVAGISKDSKFFQPIADEFNNSTASYIGTGLGASIGGALGIALGPAGIAGGALLGGLIGDRVGVILSESLPQEFNGIDDEAVAAYRAIDQLSNIMRKDLVDGMLAAAGGADKLAESPALRANFIAAAERAYIGVADAVKSLQEAFKQTGTAIGEFFKSSLPSTPFDNILQGYQAVNKAFRELDGTLGGSNLADQIKLISSMPEEMLRMLDLPQQQLLRNLAEQTAKITENEKIIAQIQAKGKEIDKTDKARISNLTAENKSLTDSVDKYEEQAESIKKTLRDSESQYKNLQQQSRQYDNQLKLINAIASANSEIYSQTAQGEKARIDRNNEAIRLQQAQLQIQINMAETYIAQTQNLIDQLEIQQTILQVTKEQDTVELQAAQRKATVAAGEAKTLALRAGLNEKYLQDIDAIINKAKNKGTQSLVDASIGNYGNITKEQLQAASVYFQSAKSLELAIARATNEISINDYTSQISDYRQNIDSLKTSVAALEVSIIGPQEALARINQKTEEYKSQIATYDREILFLNGEIEESLTSTVLLERGRTNAIRDNIRLKVEEAKRNKQILSEQSGTEIARLQGERAIIAGKLADKLEQLNQTDRDAYTAYIELLDTQIRQETELNSLRQERLTALTRQQILETIITGGLEESISKLKESLDLRKQELEVASELKTKQLEITQNAAKIAIARTGGNVTERTQKAFEVESAELAYQIAQEQYQLRLNAIDAEYALLDAKKNVDAQNLRTQVSLLQAYNRIFNNGRSNPELDAMISNVTRAASTLQGIDTQSMRLMARRSAEGDLELARQRRDLARAQYQGLNNPQSDAAQVFTNYVAEVQAMRRADTISRERIAAEQNNNQLNYSNQELELNQIIITNLEGMNRELQKIREAIIPAATALETRTVSSTVTGNVGQTVNANMNRATFLAATQGYFGGSNRTISSPTSEDIRRYINTVSTKEGNDNDRNRTTGAMGRLQFMPNTLRGLAGNNAGLASTDRATQWAAWQALSTQQKDALYQQYARQNFNALKSAIGRAPTESEWYAAQFGVGNISAAITSPESSMTRNQRAAYSGNTPALVKGLAAYLASNISPTAESTAAPAAPAAAAPIPSRTPAPTAAAPAVSAEPVAPISGVREDPGFFTAIDIANGEAFLEIQRKVAEHMAVVIERIRQKKEVAQDFIKALPSAMQVVTNQMAQLGTAMTERLGTDFGPQGRVITSLTSLISTFSTTIPNALTVLNEDYATWAERNKEMLKGVDEQTARTIHSAQQIGAAFQAASAIIGSVASLLKSISDAKIAGIDKEIAAEQKRDGKSAASVAKMDALEKKKDAMARKSFNTQKKLMLAQAVMSTAAAVAGTYASMAVINPLAAVIMAGIIGAMGLAQIAIIAGTQYESSYIPKAASTPTSLSIGRRSDSVNLAGGANANAGGEIGFLRGAQGTGTDASNYRTIGSAYGGDLMRGYGNRGFVVGEKGPEVISPETPLNVTPANDVNTTQPLNATFNIQALDASGVQDILVSQKGNIIKMLRDAANASGQGFMEDVNVNVYTRPNIGKL